MTFGLAGALCRGATKLGERSGCYKHKHLVRRLRNAASSRSVVVCVWKCSRVLQCHQLLRELCLALARSRSATTFVISAESVDDPGLLLFCHTSIYHVVQAMFSVALTSSPSRLAIDSFAFASARSITSMSRSSRLSWESTVSAPPRRPASTAH